MAYESTLSPLFAFAALSAVFGSLFLMISAEIPAWAAVRWFVFDHAQKLMALVAGTAMAASLYYSEAVGFVPCEFCWFQRIAMYPLAVLLAVAVLTRGRLEPRYLVTLAGAGLALSTYHFQLQLFPDQGGVCGGPTSCTGKYVEEFGLVTIPFMAGCGFMTVLLLQVAEWRVEYLFRHGNADERGDLVHSESAVHAS